MVHNSERIFRDNEEEAYLKEVSNIDLVTLYLRQIGDTPLLSNEEEQELSQVIQAGLRASEILQQATEKSSASVLSLAQAIVAGKSAEDHMVRANAKWVVVVAKKYRNQGLPMLDLIQEGNLGLMVAVKKYDPAKGFRFSTYATHWIRQRITRALSQKTRDIRTPVGWTVMKRKLQKVEVQLEKEHNRKPTLDEVIVRYNQVFNQTLTMKTLLNMIEQETDNLSLDEEVGGHLSLGEVVPNHELELESAIISHQLASTQIDFSELLSQLSEQAQIIIRIKVEEDEKRHAALIAEALGCSRKMVWHWTQRAFDEVRDILDISESTSHSRQTRNPNSRSKNGENFF